MEKNKSPSSRQVLAELPTAAAKLTIKVGPAQLAEGTVPPDQARHLITTFGILGCDFSGIGGVILTLHVAPTLIILAFAELAITLASAALIAACGYIPASRPGDHQQSTERQPQWREPGRHDQLTPVLADQLAAEPAPTPDPAASRK
jgi:hypothetical protein